MTDERTQDLAALYALDLLEGAERTEFEHALGDSLELQELVRELKETSGQFALVAPTAVPSDRLRQRVLQSVQSRPAALPHGGSRVRREPAPRTTPDNVVPFKPFMWAGWAAAACLGLVAAWSTHRFITTDRELTATRTLVQLNEGEAQLLRNQIEAERLIAQRQTDAVREAQGSLAALQDKLSKERSDGARALAALQGKYDLANLKVARLASLLSENPQAIAVAVWNPETQEGVLSVEKLPALASDKDYQLWVIDPQYPVPVDGGVFTVDPATGEARVEFRPKQPVAQATKFAISLERKGGAPKAEGPLVLLSQ